MSPKERARRVECIETKSCDIRRRPRTLDPCIPQSGISRSAEQYTNLTIQTTNLLIQYPAQRIKSLPLGVSYVNIVPLFIYGYISSQGNIPSECSPSACEARTGRARALKHWEVRPLYITLKACMESAACLRYEINTKCCMESRRKPCMESIRRKIHAMA